MCDRGFLIFWGMANYDDYTKAELVELGKSLGMQGLQPKSKAEIVADLEAFEAEQAPKPDLGTEAAQEGAVAEETGPVEPSVPRLDVEITQEQGQRIAGASTEALRAKLGQVPEPFHSAIVAELARREERAKEDRAAAPMRRYKVKKSAIVWRDGFSSEIRAGSIVDEDRAMQLIGMGVDVEEQDVSVVPDQLGVRRMTEIA